MNNDDFNQDQGSDSIDPVFKQKLSITMNNALNKIKVFFYRNQALMMPMTIMKSPKTR